MRVGILIFDDVEVLDFAGPFEAFGVAGARPGPAPFTVHTMAVRDQLIRARNGLIVTPTQVGGAEEKPDIFVVPGGCGTRKLVNDRETIEFIRQCSAQAALTLSVCTGALLLARAGILAGKGATTHTGALDELRRIGGADLAIYPSARVVDNGNVMTSAGISAGIDMSLYTIAKLLSMDVASETAKYMEYDWRYRVSDGEHIVMLKGSAAEAQY